MSGRAAAAAAALLMIAGVAGPVSGAPAAVHFVVRAPASTPAGATLWISGNAQALGAWNGRGLELAAQSDGMYAGTAHLESGARLEFKVTRGGWDTVEKGAHGEEIANRTWTVQGPDTIRIEVAAWRDQIEGDGPARAHTLTGDIRIHADLPSQFVRPRTVRVWLPPAYDADTTARLPVFYFHDGNNVFDAATSFIGVEWGADEAADRLVRSGAVPPFIIVAIDNTSDRITEYTHVADARRGGGGADRYARFLIEELKPFIDRTYRTRRDAAATGVIGSSLGGLVSLWLGFEHPEAFGLIGCVSPTAWWADGDLIRQVADAGASGLRIWLDMGTAEGASPADAARGIEDARRLRAALLARGYRSGIDLHYEEVEGAPHSERAWAARAGRIMQFLLAGVPAAPGDGRGR